MKGGGGGGRCGLLRGSETTTGEDESPVNEGGGGGGRCGLLRGSETTTGEDEGPVNEGGGEGADLGCCAVPKPKLALPSVQLTCIMRCVDGWRSTAISACTIRGRSFCTDVPLLLPWVSGIVSLFLLIPSPIHSRVGLDGASVRADRGVGNGLAIPSRLELVAHTCRDTRGSKWRQLPAATVAERPRPSCQNNGLTNVRK